VTSHWGEPEPGVADPEGKKLGPQVFVDSLDQPELSATDRRHLTGSLRLRAGDALVVADGVGAWRPARLGPGSDPGLEAVGPIVRVARPTPEIAIALAPAKGDRPDWAVQKMTELGADRIMVFSAARSVVRWEGERASSHLARLRRICREASMQCRRLWLPVVEEVKSFASLVARPGATLAVAGGEAPTLERPLVLIGPPGGWTDEELEALPATVGLGPNILRSETAAVTAAALLAALRIGLVSPSGR